MDLRDQGSSNRPFIIACVVCAILQVGLAPQITLAGGRINFMIVLVCMAAAGGNPSRTVICGFLCGLFYDLSAAVPVGLMSLLLTVGSFALAHSMAFQAGGTTASRSLMVGVFAFAVNAVYSIILIFMGLESSVIVAIFGHALPSAILTGLLAVPFVALGAGSVSSSGFSAAGKHQGGMRFKPKTRGLK